MKVTRTIIAFIAVLSFLVWVYFVCKNRFETTPFVICIVCIGLGIVMNDNTDTYDPYDISDMD